MLVRSRLTVVRALMLLLGSGVLAGCATLPADEDPLQIRLNDLDTRLGRLVAARKLGKKSGEGFYTWKDGKPIKAEKPHDKADLAKLGAELVEPLIAEAERALADGIVESADLVDAGVIFGTGFAPFRGGPLHYKANLGQKAVKSDAQRAAAE